MAKGVMDDVAAATPVYAQQDSMTGAGGRGSSADPGAPPVSFEEAFAAAKAAHAPKDDVTADAKVISEDADDEPETPVIEQPAQPVTGTPVATGLISDEEFSALQTKHASDPAALRKSLEGVFTKKTQALAAERTSYERLKPYQALIDRLESDPEGALTELAERAGYAIAPKDARPPVAETQVTPPVTATPAPKIADFDDLEQWGTAMADWAKTEAKREAAAEASRTFEAETKPIKEQLARAADRTAMEATAVVMKELDAKHPDWKTHEPAMLALAQQLNPAGMTEIAFLDLLYKTVTRDQWDAEREANIEREADSRFKKRVEKMTKGAAGAETPTRSVAEGNIRKRPDGPVDFQQAFADAKNGIRYED